MKSAEDCLLGFETLRAKQTERVLAYEKFLGAYFDRARNNQAGSMDATGRPILRQQAVSASDRKGAPNLLQPIVDDFTALRGIIPLMKTLPGGEGPEALEQALKQSRVVSGCWDSSNMDIQQPQAAFYLSSCGDALYMLDPLLPEDATDIDPAGIYITVYSPKLVFPKFRSGRWNQELEYVYITWDIDADDAVDQYGIKPQNDTCEVVLYYSRFEKQTLVDGQRAKTGNIQHDLGWVPGQFVRNKMTDNAFATADISQAVDVHEEIRSLAVMLLDATADTIYAPFQIRNPLEVQGDTLTIGPREVISVTDKGDVSRVMPAPPPNFAQALMGHMQDNLYHVTGTAPVRTEGQIPGSNISGRAVHAVQGPMETRLALSQAIMGYHFNKLNQKILLMYEKVPGLASAEMTLSGSDAGKPYTVSFTGKEVGGLTRQDIKWDALIGSTRHERLVMALQAYAQGLVPGSYVVSQLGEDDPERVLKQAMEEKKAMAAAMPQPPQPGQGGDPGQQQQQIMQPSQQGQALAGGSASGGPPPGGPVQPGPPSPDQGAPGGAPGGMPGFPPQESAPTAQGFGPPPQVPDVQALIGEALGQLPAEVSSEIVGEPTIASDGAVVIPVASFKAISAIKKAFRAVGLRARPKVSQGEAA